MESPMKALYNFFTENAYVESGPDDKTAGVIINEELFEKLQEYLKEAQNMMSEASIDIEGTNIQYENQIESANAQIRLINQKINEINARRDSSYSQQVINMLEKAINELRNNVTLEISNPTRSKDQNGNPVGGNLSTVSDPKLRKNLGGIITSVKDASDYSGQYARLENIINVLGPVVDEIYKQQQNEQQRTIPNIQGIVAEKTKFDAGEAIHEIGTKNVKVTQKTLLNKRVVPVMLALGVFASIAVGALRGTNVNISGAHGNSEYTTGVTEEINEAQNEAATALGNLEIHLQGQLEEERAIHKFNGDPAFVAEERGVNAQNKENEIIAKGEEIQRLYGGDISLLSNEEAAQCFIARYRVLIEQYEYTNGIYEEDSECLDGIKDANNEHINISNGTQAPGDNQNGLVNSLDEKDIKRHKSQNKTAEGILEKNLKLMLENEQKKEDAQKRIDFINILRQQKGFKDINPGNFENTFESLYQMYNKRADQVSMEDFMKLIDENGYNLNIMAEYAKEELPDLSLEESLGRFGLINNSYEIYLEQYALNGKKVDISSYTQYVNQYIEDNPEIRRDGGIFTIIKGQFSQNDMNAGFYEHRQNGGTKEGVINRIFGNIKTLLNRERRGKYQEAVNQYTKSIKAALNQDENRVGDEIWKKLN